MIHKIAITIFLIFENLKKKIQKFFQAEAISSDEVGSLTIEISLRLNSQKVKFEQKFMRNLNGANRFRPTTDLVQIKTVYLGFFLVLKGD